MDGRIYDLRNDLLAHLDHDWTVQEMAERAGLSVSHFPTVFKGVIGMSPGAYLKEARLEKARHLLETTHEQIKQIAIQVGMANESHFTRDFKIRYGLTPTAYRRQFQDNQQAERLNGQKP